MSETIEELRNKFMEGEGSFGEQGIEVNLGKTKVMVSGAITKDGLSIGEVDPCLGLPLKC